jgi:hypothetical protein
MTDPRDEGPLGAALRLAAHHGVRVIDPVVLKHGSNLLVHLRPAPVVVRVATFTAVVRGDPWSCLAHEVALVTWLAAAGAAVMAPSPWVPPGPHLVDGWAMDAWAYVDHEAGAVPAPLAALDALFELHEVMRGYPGELPRLSPIGEDLERAVGTAVRLGIFTEDQAADTLGRRDALRTSVLAAGPVMPALHGDAFPRNALVTDRGIVWIDLEDACSGPAIWDLATLARRDGTPEVLARIGERHDPEALRAAIALRQVQADVWNALHDARDVVLPRTMAT